MAILFLVQLYHNHIDISKHAILKRLLLPTIRNGKEVATMAIFFQELTQLFNAICVAVVMFAIKRYFDDRDGR